MATPPVFQGILTVLDRATAPLRAIQGSLGNVTATAARATASMRKMKWDPAAQIAAFKAAELAAEANARAIWSVADVSERASLTMRTLRAGVAPLRAVGASARLATRSVRALHAGIMRLRGGMLGGYHQIAHFLTPLGVLGGLTTAGGLMETVNKVSEQRSQMLMKAAKVGATPGQLGGAMLQARMADVDPDSLVGGLTKLNKGLAEAAAGGNKKLASAFAALHIPLRDVHNQVRSAIDVLPDMAAAMEKNTNAAVRTRIAMAAFGKSGADLIPMLKEGPAKWKEIAADVGRLTYKFSDEDNENLEKYHKTWIRLQIATAAFGNQIASLLAPVLTPLIHDFTDWVAVNRSWISLEIKRHVEEFGTFLRNFDWKGAGRTAQSGLSWAKWGIEQIGGMTRAFEILAGVMGAPYVAAMANAAAGFIGLGKGATMAAVGLVKMAWGFRQAAVAQDAFMAGANKNPLFRAGMVALWAYDKAAAGAPLSDLDPDMQSRMVRAAEKPANYNWWDPRKYLLTPIGGGGDIWSKPNLGIPNAAFPTGSGDLQADLRALAQGDWTGPVPFLGVQPAGSGGGLAGGMTQTSGDVRIRLDINGLPSGAVADVQSTGTISQPQVNLGANLPGPGFD